MSESQLAETIKSLRSAIKKITDIPAKQRTAVDRDALRKHRLALADQQKIRLTKAQDRLRLDERKSRTQRLIKLGGLVVKAKLDHLDEAALLGALDIMRETLERDSKVIAHWQSRGGSLLVSAAQADNRVPLTVVFPAPADKETRKILRGMKLRWSEALGHWDGVADLDAVKKAVSTNGGIVKRVGEPAPQSTAQQPAKPDPQRVPAAAMMCLIVTLPDPNNPSAVAVVKQHNCALDQNQRLWFVDYPPDAYQAPLDALAAAVKPFDGIVRAAPRR